MYDYQKELDAVIRQQKRHENAIKGIYEWRYNDAGSKRAPSATINDISYAIMDGLGLSRMETENLLANL